MARNCQVTGTDSSHDGPGFRGWAWGQDPQMYCQEQNIPPLYFALILKIVYKYIIPERLWLNLWALRFLPLYYFLRGAAPKKIVGSGRNRRPIDSTGASKKRNDIFVLYPSSTTFMEASSYFHVLCWSISS